MINFIKAVGFSFTNIVKKSEAIVCKKTKRDEKVCFFVNNPLENSPMTTENKQYRKNMKKKKLNTNS